MGISLQPCKVTMPADGTGCTTVIEFLIKRFPRVDAQVWRERVKTGKVHWDDGSLVAEASAYAPQQRVFYYREVDDEPEIPFREEIVYRDDEILVVCKPHFLPVNPIGRYVQQSLINRLAVSTGITTLAPLHRIDRETAGLVMLSVNPNTRSLYHQLFLGDGRITKTYRALARVTADNRPQAGQRWRIENRMVEGEPWFRMTTAAGEINARSEIHCLEVYQHRALFELRPLTGKTHQLRLHMSDLGFPLVNDRLYPTLQPEAPDNFAEPLQLLAYKLEFIDPVSELQRSFVSPRTLIL